MAHEVSIVIRAKDAATKILHGISGGFKSFISGIANAGKWLFAAGAQVAVLGAAVKRLVGEYQKAAAVEARLASVQKATGYASGITTAALKRQAATLQDLTGVNDEVTMSAQALLASFGNISGENFTRVTVAALDMATALQRAGDSEASVESAAQLLGKALADPEQAAGRLMKAGVSLTDSQESSVKAMAKQGQTAKAQAMLLDIIEGKYKGAAQAVNEQTGKVKTLAQAWGDLQETLGGAIAKNSGLASVTERLTAAIKDLIESGKIDAWVEELKASLDDCRPALMFFLGIWEKIGTVLSAAKSGLRIVADMAGQLSTGTLPSYNAASDREAERLGKSDKVTAAAEKLAAQRKQDAALAEALEKVEMEAAQRKAQALKATEEAARKAGDAAYQAWLDEEAAIIEALSAEAEYDKALTEKKERYAELTAEMQAAREKEANLAPYRAKLALLDRELDLLRDIKAAADDRMRAASAPDARAKQAEAAEAAEAQKKADVADWKRWNRNVAKMGKRGVTLSDEEQKWMQGVFGAHKEKVLAKEAADKAAADVAAKEKEVAEWRKRMEVLADDQLTEWKKLRTALEANLVAP